MNEMYVIETIKLKQMLKTGKFLGMEIYSVYYVALFFPDDRQFFCDKNSMFQSYSSCGVISLFNLEKQKFKRVMVRRE